MTPEERQKAISEAFYRISIYAMVTHTCTKEGEHRLQYMLNMINEIPVVYDVEYHNFNHRYFKDLLEQAIDDNKICLDKIKEKIFKKDSQEKITCQRKAYQVYGDELLQDFDERQKEIAKDNFRADSINRNNLEALGLKAKMFAVESKEKATEINSLEEDKKIQKQQRQKINSRNNLYNKSELTHLRRKFISLCQIEINQQIYQYQNELKEQCDKLLEYDEILTE